MSDTFPLVPVTSNLAPLHPGYGHRVDGHKVMWWGTKKQAIAGAKAIGWSASDVVPVHTRFQAGYAIAVRGLGGWLGRETYAELLATRAAHTEETQR